MSNTTDTTALQALAVKALRAEEQAQHTQQAEIDAELVADAQAYAVLALGKEAAATLGEWVPVDAADSPPDTAQAAVALMPGVLLIYTEDEDGKSLTLSGDCRTCSHHQDLAVYDLTGLARALRQIGSAR